MLNKKLLEEINKTGKLFLSGTTLNGRYVIRIAISGIRTKAEHINNAKQLIDQKLSRLLK